MVYTYQLILNRMMLKEDIQDNVIHLVFSHSNICNCLLLILIQYIIYCTRY
jgi:hypothetical protein